MKVRKLQKKKYIKKKKSKFKTNHKEIKGLLISAAGLLTAIGMYITAYSGPFGEFIKSFLTGFTGWISFLVPVLILTLGIAILFNKNSESFRKKYICTLILLAVMCAFTHTASYNFDEYNNLGVAASIQKFYILGNDFKSGGVIGGIISLPFLAFFKVLGTLLILLTMAVINIMILTELSIANAMIKILNKIKTLIKRKKNAEVKKVKSKKTEVNNKDDLDEKYVFTDEENFKSDTTEQNTDVGFEMKEDPAEAVLLEDLRESAASSIQSGEDFNYMLPPFELLNSQNDTAGNKDEIKIQAMDGAQKLEDTLQSFGVDAKVVNVSRGPAVTRYELHPSPGVKVSRIVSLSDDISLNLAASGIRIEAPIPGKAAVGIEVPNKQISNVLLREVIETSQFVNFPSKLAFALGKDISGDIMIADIAKMPHILIAGATGSGKSVCINSLIISLLYKSTPDEVKLLMIDPKVVELGIYNGIPHLLIPVVTDPRKAAGALNWAVQEMVRRYKLFAEKGVRDIRGYNQMMFDSEEGSPMPQIVIIIDELADLMMVAPNDVEDAICRLAQMARAAGMHLVIATQRPSVDIITGVIKANIPSRIAFAVSSQVDSRTIIDMAGAEKLLGKGDMLFYPVGEPKPIRVKCAFVSDKEVEAVVEFVKNQGNTQYSEEIIDKINNGGESKENDTGDKDPLLAQAIELVVDSGQASASLIQRKFKVGYARAARIVDQMETRGIVGPHEGSKPRQVLLTRQQLLEMNMSEFQ